MSVKRKIIFEGELGAKFGYEREVSAKSVAEVIRIYECNFPEFKKYMIDSSEKGVGYIVKVNDREIEDERELLLDYPEGSIVFTPAPAGSDGVRKVIVGIILIIAAVVYVAYTGDISGGAALAQLASAGAFSSVAAFVFNLGIVLALSGFAEMLAPDPSVDDLENRQDDSNVFQGAGTNIVQGDPVPVIYGKLRVPGRPISFESRNVSQSFYNYSRVESADLGTNSSTPSPVPRDPGFFPGNETIGGGVRGGSANDGFFVNRDLETFLAFEQFRTGGGILPTLPPRGLI